MPSLAHAIQIVIALDGCVAICGKDEGRESRGIVVRPDAEHSFDCNGALGVMVFVDAAPLTRTFYRMVGMAPSVSMRGDFIEISSPFNTLPRGSAERQFPRPTE